MKSRRSPIFMTIGLGWYLFDYLKKVIKIIFLMLALHAIYAIMPLFGWKYIIFYDIT